ncbi:glycosyl hydrolase family 28-related protein [Pelagicoccus mobilis]|uniref:Rhamnogalacturonase A/B/Epimerase-like pectate lyase domain-containing protein n=1 Tax=Pelagicoccus mobilis TaxID=415221 RepID=A0A934VJM4_9BACT|nr:glycosyl hydrolase family 28-related protein [Pelagicoccus mobilis]MBK1875781.1 hypothetical protein [Pelagicoccus mobilis]
MRIFLTIIVFVLKAVSLCAGYLDTSDSHFLRKDLQKDFGMVDDGGARDQTKKLQRAIDRISESGGGRLYLPKGTYSFANVFLKSNVHLRIAADTVIRPYWPEGGRTVVFHLDSREGKRPGPMSARINIENVSIRGVGGSFIIDYSNRPYDKEEGIRAIVCRKVKNFMISDVLIKDSWTRFAAIVFAPDMVAVADEDSIYKPTDGLVRNCSATDSNSENGLVQMHAGERIHFEGLAAVGGGVTLRLETSAGGHRGGIYDITAKDIYCEDGMSAVLLGPHTAQNGVVEIDGVLAKGCAFAVQMGAGFVKRELQRDPSYKPGVFSVGTVVRNIHAEYGENAPLPIKHLGLVRTECLGDYRLDKRDRSTRHVRGPSVGIVFDGTRDSWTPAIETISCEGFEYARNIVVEKEIQRVRLEKLLEGYPLLDELRQAESPRLKPKAPPLPQKF